MTDEKNETYHSLLHHAFERSSVVVCLKWEFIGSVDQHQIWQDSKKHSNQVKNYILLVIIMNILY